MGKNTNEARIALIFSKLAQVGPFLPGNVRKSIDRRKTANGEIKDYEAQPIFNYAAATGKRKDKRIPKNSYALVKRLTENYKRFSALLRELNEAMIEAYLPDVKKND